MSEWFTSKAFAVCGGPLTPEECGLHDTINETQIGSKIGGDIMIPF